MANYFLLSVFLSIMYMNVVLSESTLKYKSNEFEAKMVSHKLAAVTYYAPWCHYSRALLPEFENTAYVLNSVLNLDVGMVKIDCYDELQKDICSRKGIVSYPTIKIYRNGTFFKDFHGERKSRTLSYYLLDIIHGLIK